MRKENEHGYFCRTCQTVTCTLCVIEAHSEHSVEEADVLYNQNTEEIGDLQNTVEDMVKRQRDVKTKIETMHQQILQSYQQVSSIYLTNNYNQNESLFMHHYIEMCVNWYSS